jgi:hypothetical protein
MLEWSVNAIAGIPKDFAFSTSFSIDKSPLNMLYSDETLK